MDHLQACPAYMGQKSTKLLIVLLLPAAAALLAAIHQVVVGNVDLALPQSHRHRYFRSPCGVVMYPSSTVQRPNRWPLSGFIAAFIPFMLRIYSSSQEKSPAFKSVQ